MLLTGLMLSTALLAQKKGEYLCQRHTDISPEDGAAFIDRMQYDEKSKLMYFFSNDNERLYIDIVIADRPTMQKVMMYGLTTWINPDGKTKKNSGIRFPLAPARRDMKQPAGREPGRDRDRMVSEMMEARNREMAVFGFPGMQEEVIVNPALDEDYRGSVSRLGEDRMLVTLSLPLDKLGRSAGQNLSKPLSVGVESGYLDLNRQGMGMQSSGMQGGGPPSGGHHPTDGERSVSTSGRPGGTGQGGQFDLNEMSKPAKLWIKAVKLAD